MSKAILVRPSAMDGRGLKQTDYQNRAQWERVRPSAMDGRGLKLRRSDDREIDEQVRPSAMDGRGLKRMHATDLIAKHVCARPPWTGED